MKEKQPKSLLLTSKIISLIFIALFMLVDAYSFFAINIHLEDGIAFLSVLFFITDIMTICICLALIVLFSIAIARNKQAPQNKKLFIAIVVLFAILISLETLILALSFDYIRAFFWLAFVICFVIYILGYKKKTNSINENNSAN